MAGELGRCPNCVFCTGLALVVFYLMWKASEDTNWQSKRSINPYKLVGGIIGGLG